LYCRPNVNSIIAAAADPIKASTVMLLEAPHVLWNESIVGGNLKVDTKVSGSGFVGLKSTRSVTATDLLPSEVTIATNGVELHGGNTPSPPTVPTCMVATP
jgi:hypothetical protein